MMDYQEAIKEAEAQIDIYKSTALKRKKFDPSIENRIIENKIDFFSDCNFCHEKDATN